VILRALKELQSKGSLLAAFAMSKLLSLLLLCLIVTNAFLPRFCLCVTSEKNEQSAYVTHAIKQIEMCTDCGHADLCCSLIHKSCADSDDSPTSNFQTCLEILVSILSSGLRSLLPNDSTKALFQALESVLTKWPCAKFYLAKQSLLI